MKLIDLTEKTFTLLHLASLFSTVKAIEILVKKSASLEIQDYYRAPPLMNLVSESTYNCAMDANENQNTQLADKLNCLLDLGADEKARHIRKQKPLYFIHASVANQLIRAGT